MSRDITGRAGCTVRALALAAGISIELANEIAASMGRQKGRRFKSAKVIAGAKAAGHQVRKVRFSKARTLARFLREHPTGRFYVRGKGHAWVIADGVSLQAQPDGKRIVEAWEFKS